MISMAYNPGDRSFRLATTQANIAIVLGDSIHFGRPSELVRELNVPKDSLIFFPSQGETVFYPETGQLFWKP